MLWKVRHEWPSGAQFNFNCYCHWETLVIRDCGGAGHFLYIKEGVIQGYLIAMIAYCIGVIPLIREIQEAHPNVSQPWYANDAGSGGTFHCILDYLDGIIVSPSMRRYYLDLTKIILIVSDPKLAQESRSSSRWDFHFHSYVLTIYVRLY